MAKVGDFGTIYTQFKNKPKEAIKHLKRVKEGECTKALYRPDIGYIDIVWGEHDNKTSKGFGLKHIIASHKEEVKQLGFEVEDFILVVFSFGKVSVNKMQAKIHLDGENFRMIIKTEWNGKEKRFLMSSFDLRPIIKKNPKRAIIITKKAPNKKGF